MTDLRAMRLALLINERCGHVAGVCGAEYASMVEVRRARLAVHGFRGWRVEVRPATDAELEGMVAGSRCRECSLDGVTS